MFKPKGRWDRVSHIRIQRETWTDLKSEQVEKFIRDAGGGWGEVAENCNQIILPITIFLAKLIFCPLVRNSLPSIEHDIPVSSSQQSSTGTQSEPTESNPHSHPISLRLISILSFTYAYTCEVFSSHQIFLLRIQYTWHGATAPRRATYHRARRWHSQDNFLLAAS